MIGSFIEDIFSQLLTQLQKIICSVIGSIAEDNLLSDILNYRRLFAQLLAKLQKIICSVIGSITEDYLLSDWLNYRRLFAQ